MTLVLVVATLVVAACTLDGVASFQLLQQPQLSITTRTTSLSAATEEEETTAEDNGGSIKKDNKAMAFLKKIGRVGHRQDFTNAMGVDEGSVGKSSASGTTLRKSKQAYPTLSSEAGLIDALEEPFPLTALGTSWSGYTDQVMGGKSTGVLERSNDYYGRTANVLRGKVRLLPGEANNKAGFVQMAADLVLRANEDGASVADASSFDGVQLDILYEGENAPETFNVHFKTTACAVPNASYRATFEIAQPNEWTTIQVPWSEFVGHGAGAVDTPFDPSQLVRMGVVAIGREMPSLVLAVSQLQLYRKSSDVEASS